jgi:type II secretion system protein N
MNKLLNVLYVLTGLIVFLLLVWFFAIPVSLIQSNIEDVVAQSGNNNMKLSIEGLRKGLFLNLYADQLDLEIDNKPALIVTEFTGRFAPGYLLDGKLAVRIKGNIADGELNGVFQLPVNGEMKIERAALDKIPYLTRFGIDVKGSAYAEIFMDIEAVNIVFKVPDLSIDESTTIIPLLNTFHALQGSVSIIQNKVQVESVSLEGDKGYARLKGNIINNRMDLAIELMPDREKLNALESMMIGKYIVSPGYYVVPIKGMMPL